MGASEKIPIAQRRGARPVALDNRCYMWASRPPKEVQQQQWYSCKTRAHFASTQSINGLVINWEAGHTRRQHYCCGIGIAALI